MSDSFNEYMTYCDNQHDGAGYTDNKNIINGLLDDLDAELGAAHNYSKYEGKTHLQHGKRHRGDYQYGKS